LIGKWALSTALLVCAGLNLEPRLPAQQAAPTSDENQILELQKVWTDAEETADRATLERILDDGFVFTTRVGKPLEKKDFIAMFMSNKIGHAKLVTTDLIRVTGNTAIVLSRFGFGDKLDMQVFWVAIKRDGQWRALGEHLVALPDPPSMATPPPAQK
jgi:ketosteroid isomerase-like protein